MKRTFKKFYFVFPFFSQFLGRLLCFYRWSKMNEIKSVSTAVQICCWFGQKFCILPGFFFITKEIYPLHPICNVPSPVDMKWTGILVHPHRGELQKVFVQKVYLGCVVWIYKKVFSKKVLIYSKNNPFINEESSHSWSEEKNCFVWYAARKIVLYIQFRDQSVLCVFLGEKRGQKYWIDFYIFCV